LNKKIICIANEILGINKEAIPHILLKNKKPVDLYFEFLDMKERSEFFEDLNSKEQPHITLPDYGQIGRFNISNPITKEISKDDLAESDERLIKRFVDKGESTSPVLEYDKNKHEYKLKSKHDLEKIIREVVYADKH
jgi:hypothetical protein